MPRDIPRRSRGNDPTGGRDCDLSPAHPRQLVDAPPVHQRLAVHRGFSSRRGAAPGKEVEKGGAEGEGAGASEGRRRALCVEGSGGGSGGERRAGGGVGARSCGDEQ